MNDWETVVDNEQTELLDPIKEGVIREDQVHELGDLLIGKVTIKQPARGTRHGHYLLQEQFRPRDPVRGRRRHHLQQGDQQGNNKTIPTEWLGSDLRPTTRPVPAVAMIGG